MKDKKSFVTIFNARIIGIFFLLAFLAYGLGTQLFGSTNNPEKYLGALLIIANSVIVFFYRDFIEKNIEVIQPVSWQYLPFHKNI